MESSLRVVKMIRLFMLASVVAYIGIAAGIARPKDQVNVIIFYALTVMAASMVMIILLVRRFMIALAEAILADQPDNTGALQRWRTGYLMTYVLCEAVGLYGLVLQFLGFTLSQVAPFYIAAIALLLFFSPRLPSRELS